MAHIITLIPGDGIGPEVTQAVLSVLAATGVAIEWETHDAGVTAVERSGHALPDELIASIRRNKVALKGPVTTPIGQGFTSVTIQFKPFGVRLDFTGYIQNDNTIRLHVAPEVSALDFANALTLQGFVVPAITTRRAETDVELKDGQSFAIAGLLDHRATTQLSKVPGIGDIPVLGQLFRSRNINKNNTELLVMVTPHIIDPIHTTTPVPALPKITTPYLDPKSFDKTAPGNNELGTSNEGSTPSK